MFDMDNFDGKLQALIWCICLSISSPSWEKSGISCCEEIYVIKLLELQAINNKNVWLSHNHPSQLLVDIQGERTISLWSEADIFCIRLRPDKKVWNIADILKITMPEILMDALTLLRNLCNLYTEPSYSDES